MMKPIIGDNARKIDLANMIRNSVIAEVKSDPENFLIHEKIIAMYEEVDDASWWIDMRPEFGSKQNLLVFSWVMLANLGDAEACGVVVNMQDDLVLAPLFDRFKVYPEES